jgi:dephospho-CoA kinase
MFKKDVKIIGIAGKIASGKSYVGQTLHQKGYEVIDVDKVAHEVLGLDFVKDRVRKIFGDAVFADNGDISRKKLGDLVFSDETMLFTLNQLLFGIIYIRTVEKLLALDTNIVFIENALLFSMGLDHICDMVIYVISPDEDRLKRIIKNRGFDEERARKRLNSQDDIPDYSYPKSCFIIHNTGSLDDLAKRLDELLREI